MSGEFCVSIEDVITAASMTVQAATIAGDELSAGESRLAGNGPDTFRGTATSALGEFGTYLANRRTSLEDAVEGIVGGLRTAAATFDTTETDSQTKLDDVQKSVRAHGSPLLKL